MADVRLRKIKKSYGEVTVLQDIDLDIENGEFVVFVGPSGCGKSTLLRVIAGLEDTTGGDLLVDGQQVNQVPPAERGIAMVFQSYALYPHMTLYENMAFSLKLAKIPKPEIDTAIQHAAQILKIEHLLSRKPKALSGGQRQRVAIGRAIVRKPKVFLFDEPLSNLDAALRVKMRYEFAKLHQELKTTMIYVTHDQVEAMTLADKIVVLSNGRIEQVGAPLELYHYPCNLFVAGFIGSPKMNFIEAEIVSGSKAHAQLRLPSGETIQATVDASSAKPGDRVTLGIRPEHFRLGINEINIVEATAIFVEPLGDITFAYFLFPGTAEGLTVKLPADTQLKANDVLKLTFPANQCHLFDSTGKAFPRQPSLAPLPVLHAA